MCIRDRSTCSLATKPLRLSCTIALSFVLMLSAATVIPVPAPILNVLLAVISPPPVNPEPAVNVIEL